VLVALPASTPAAAPCEMGGCCRLTAPTIPLFPAYPSPYRY